MIDKLTELFLKFPGVGRRQARRFSYFLIAQNADYVESFISTLVQLREQVSQCGECCAYFPKSGSKLCPICLKYPNADIIVVEKDMDRENILRSDKFSGRVFVLGSFRGDLDKAEHLPRLGKLKSMLERGQGKVRELILAFSVNPIGKRLEEFLLSHLDSLSKKYNFTIRTLGRGVSTGSELEYLDDYTIEQALINRK